MDTLFAIAKGRASKGNRMRVFDWDKAAQLIKDKKPNCAGAGLQGDWEWTGGTIFENGSPVKEEDTYIYLASTWAVPGIDIDGVIEPCWKYIDETTWNAKTYWPDSALAIVF